MSDENAPTTDPTPQGDGDSTDWKAEARKWEARAKENFSAVEKLKELEDAEKDEVVRQAEKISLLENDLAAYKARDQIAEWSKEITKDSHVPAAALRGSSKEELEKHHAELVALIPKPKQPTPNTWDRPDPNISGDGEFVAQLFGRN